MTEIALARIPASDPAHRIGTVFVNPGGPGGSGVGLVLFGFGEFLAEQLDGRFDVVGFDPRGIGASDPLHCFDSGTSSTSSSPSCRSSRTSGSSTARSSTHSQPRPSASTTARRSPRT